MGDKSKGKKQVPDYVRAALFSSDRQTVVMVKEDGPWDLPYFVYSDSLFNGNNIGRCCDDLKQWFGVSREATYFFATVELLGVSFRPGKYPPHQTGREKLMIVEMQPESDIEGLLATPPKPAELKKREFVSSSLVKPENTPMSTRCVIILRNYMHPSSTILASLSDPRYQPGWYRRESERITSMISCMGLEVRGRVIQVHMSYTSTLLKVNSSGGWFFVKAPALGCREGSITAQIASLFPECSTTILNTYDDLNRFVSKAFSDIELKQDDMCDVVLQLGHVQLNSLPHLEKLKTAGCPVRDFDSLEEQIELWSRGEGEWTQFCFGAGDLVELLPVVSQMCRQLKEYRIPFTLVHGDPALWNATHEPADSRNVLLFDWEFACIGHPFCDFHELHEDLSQDLVDEYLTMWATCEDIEKAREAFEIARKLGWILKMWSLADWSTDCNPQSRSSLEHWMLTLPTRVYEEIVGSDASETTR